MKNTYNGLNAMDTTCLVNVTENAMGELNTGLWFVGFAHSVFTTQPQPSSQQNFTPYILCTLFRNHNMSPGATNINISL